MAMFQPFNKAPTRKIPDLMGLEKMRADYEAKDVANRNARRNQAIGAATGIGTGLYGEYTKPESPIGGYLRRMTGAEDAAGNALGADGDIIPQEGVKGTG